MRKTYLHTNKSIYKRIQETELAAPLGGCSMSLDLSQKGKDLRVDAVFPLCGLGLGAIVRINGKEGSGNTGQN